MPAESTLPVPPDQLQDKVQEVLARPDYQDANLEPSNELSALIARLIEWVLIPLRWLFELTEGLPSVLRWIIVVGLILLLLALMFHIGWSLYRAVVGADSGRKRGPRLSALDEQRPADPAELERLAETATADGDLIQAVRLLFRAALLRLEQREKRPFRRGTTNRQHLNRYRGTSFFQPLEVLVQTIERKWYGDEICEPAHLAACQQAHLSVRQALRGVTHADTT